MSRALLPMAIALGAIAAAAPAHADRPGPPPAGPRRLDPPADPRDRTLVLVAPPAVLVEAAVRTGLAPWRIEIVVIDTAASTPDEIATVNRAGFVAIGAGGELHLYDHDAPVAQRRPMPADLGEADAAALALTIKTWMRLGPPPPLPTDAAAPPVVGMAPTGEPAGPIDLTLADRAPAAATTGRTWRVGATAAFGIRGDQGGLGELGARAIVAAHVATPRLDVAAGLELGAGGEVWDGDQRAAWSEWLGFVRVSRRIAIGGAVAVRPIAGLALVRSAVDGERMSNGQRFDMATSNLGVDGAVELAWRSGRLDAGVTFGITAVPRSQVLRDRNVAFSLPARVEPWGSVGVGASF